MSPRFDQPEQSVKFEIDYCGQNDVLPLFQIISVSMNDTTLLVITLQEDHSILSFSRKSENSDWVLQWWFMRKYIWKHLYLEPLKTIHKDFSSSLDFCDQLSVCCYRKYCF